MSDTLEQLVYQAVVGNTGITSLLALDAGNNIAFYDKQLPQQGGAYPAGVYQRIASPRLFTMGPVPQANVGRARFQLTFWANAKNGTAVLGQIDAAVIAMFRGFNAYNPPGSPATLIQPGFIAYDSKTLIEPQAQPTLQKLEITVQFWFSDFS